MTAREKLAIEHPDKIDPSGEVYLGGCAGCPHDRGYLERPEHCKEELCGSEACCTACWDREIPETIEEIAKDYEQIYNDFKEGKITANEAREKMGLPPIGDTPRILDSGNRTEFATGAVRDMREGKGRCDLMPLDVISDYLRDEIIGYISNFQQDGDDTELFECLDAFAGNYDSKYGLVLELAKHFEEGAKKYGENNWQKGIELRWYIDSAVRHYLKFLRGDKDEPHDRAFCWNIMCAIWTCKHKSELNDYAPKKIGDVVNNVIDEDFWNDILQPDECSKPMEEPV